MVNKVTFDGSAPCMFHRMFNFPWPNNEADFFILLRIQCKTYCDFAVIEVNVLDISKR